MRLRQDDRFALRFIADLFPSPGIHYGFHGETPERTCKSCTDDIFACGLYEWWERKRPTVLSQLEKEVQRPNCKNGRNCYRQGNGDHARKFNHVCAPAPPEIIDSITQDDGAPVASSSNSTSASASAAGSSSNLAVPATLVAMASSTNSETRSIDSPSESLPVVAGAQATSSTGEAPSTDADSSMAVDAPAEATAEVTPAADSSVIDPSAVLADDPPPLSPPDSSEEERDQEKMAVDEPIKLDGLPGEDEPVLGGALPREAVAAAV